jgi:hypothetical protein
VEHLGDIMIAHIKVSGLDTLLTVKTPAVLLQVGQAVVLRPQTTKALAFDTDGRIL